MPTSPKSNVAKELMTIENGRREDASLHDEILNDGNAVAATAIGIKTMRRLGLSERQISSLIKPKGRK
jgi:hypothetical protein